MAIEFDFPKENNLLTFHVSELHENHQEIKFPIIKIDSKHFIHIIGVGMLRWSF